MLFFLILKIICILKNIQQQSNRIYSRTLYPVSSNRDDIATIKLRRIALDGKRNHKPRGGDCRYSISNSPPPPLTNSFTTKGDLSTRIHNTTPYNDSTCLSRASKKSCAEHQTSYLCSETEKKPIVLGIVRGGEYRYGLNGLYFYFNPHNDFQFV